MPGDTVGPIDRLERDIQRIRTAQEKQSASIDKVLTAQTSQERHVRHFAVAVLSLLLAVGVLSVKQMIGMADLVTSEELKRTLQPLHPDKVFITLDSGEVLPLNWPLGVPAEYLKAKEAAAGDGTVAIENRNPDENKTAAVWEVLGGEVITVGPDPLHPDHFQVRVKHRNGYVSTYGRLSDFDQEIAVVGQDVASAAKLGIGIPASPVCVTYKLERPDGTVVEGLVEAFQRVLGS